MNTITLTIAATPDNLKRLADAFGDCIDETLHADDIPAHRRPTAQDAPKGETIKSAEIEIPVTATVEVKEPENVTKELENVTKRDENAPAPTLSDIRVKAAETVKDGHGEALKALLDKYEVEKVPNLPEEKYAAFFADLEAIK